MTEKKPPEALPKLLLGTPDEVSNFITGAVTERQPLGEFPWDAPHLKKRNKRPLRVDMPEALKLRLDFIAQNTPYSRVGFILAHVEEIIIKESDLLIAKGFKPIKEDD